MQCNGYQYYYPNSVRSNPWPYHNGSYTSTASSEQHQAAQYYSDYSAQAQTQPQPYNHGYLNQYPMSKPQPNQMVPSYAGQQGMSPSPYYGGQYYQYSQQQPYLPYQQPNSVVGHDHDHGHNHKIRRPKKKGVGRNSRATFSTMSSSGAKSHHYITSGYKGIGNAGGDHHSDDEDDDDVSGSESEYESGESDYEDSSHRRSRHGPVYN